MSAESTPVFKRGSHPELAEALLKRIRSVSDGVVCDEDVLYRYVPASGAWQRVSEDDLHRMVQKFDGAKLKKPPFHIALREPDVKGVVKCAKAVATQPSFFAKAPIGLAFNNKKFVAVDAAGLKAEKLTKDHRIRSLFNFPYDPEARSPEFEAFVYGLFRDDPDCDEKVNFIQEIFGASLVRLAPRLQKCALLIGDGSNGKDTVIEVLRDVFPTGTVSSLPPHRWNQEYARAGLAGKWLNIVGELPEVELAASEAFKAIIAGTPVDARNPYGRFFDVTPEAGHIFAINNPMATPDFSHGFFRRFGIVRFNRIIAEAEADRNIPERMRAHRPAIAAWLLTGAARVLARGHYVLPTSHTKEIADWRLQADQVAMFLEERTRALSEDERKRGSGIEGSVLFQEYAAWARANEHRPMSSTKFGLRAKLYLREKGLGQAQVHGKSRTVKYPLKLSRSGRCLTESLQGERVGERP